MFEGLPDADLTALIAELRSAAIKLAIGQATSQIRYGEFGEVFHPADLEKTEDFLNRAIAEQRKRAGEVSTMGAIFPAGV